MKKLTLLLFCVILAACSSMNTYLPTWRKFPEQKDPIQLEPCPDLKKIEQDEVSITKFLDAVVS